MRQPNGCSTPDPKSSAAKQWIKEDLALPFYYKRVHQRQEFRQKPSAIDGNQTGLPFGQRS